LKKLTTQAESVVQVLDAEDFAESVLNEITAGFNAEGAALEADGRRIDVGLTSGTSPIVLPLEYRDEQVGTLKIWPRLPAATDAEINDAARQAAAVLARVIALAPAPNPTGRTDGVEPSPVPVTEG
jgi:hypothetical protein